MDDRERGRERIRDKHDVSDEFANMARRMKWRKSEENNTGESYADFWQRVFGKKHAEYKKAQKEKECTNSESDTKD